MLKNLQSKIYKKLMSALKYCARANLGVYCYDSNIFVCPQPEGRNYSLLGEELLIVPRLDCDGGAGI